MPNPQPKLKEKLYYVPRAVFVPVALGIAAIWLAWANDSPWPLAALPFIFLGSLCAAPNHNLVDGFLAFVAMALGMIVANYQKELGSAIGVGTFSSWFLSGIEKRIRATPVDDDRGQPD
jgi:hypothetical protein